MSDKFSNPNWVASDLIAQAEHDEFSQSILVTIIEILIAKVNKSLSFQLLFLPKKKLQSQVLEILVILFIQKKLVELSKL